MRLTLCWMHWYLVPHSILMRVQIYLHFIDKDIAEVTCPRSHTERKQNQDWTQVVGLLASSVPPPNATDSPWKAVVLRKAFVTLVFNWTAITHPTHFHLNCNCETESLFSNSYKVSWGISPSDQDGVTGTRFTFLFGETIKNGPDIFYKYSKKSHIVLKKEPVCKHWTPYHKWL